MWPPVSSRNRGLINAWRARRSAGKRAAYLDTDEITGEPLTPEARAIEDAIGWIIAGLVTLCVLAAIFVYWPRHLEDGCPNNGARLNFIEYELQKRTCEANRNTGAHDR